jgi:hypothetical protein
MKQTIRRSFHILLTIGMLTLLVGLVPVFGNVAYAKGKGKGTPADINRFCASKVGQDEEASFIFNSVVCTGNFQQTFSYDEVCQYQGQRVSRFDPSGTLYCV